MTSITQLLSPWPVSKHSIVLRDQPHYPPPHSSMLPESLDVMHQHQPSPPMDAAHNDAVTGSAESDQGENTGDGRKGYGKRELSTSKRAAQNRAAQVCISYVSTFGTVALTSFSREHSASARKDTSRSLKSRFATTRLSATTSKLFRPRTTNCEITLSIFSHASSSHRVRYHLHQAMSMAFSLARPDLLIRPALCHDYLN